MKHATQISFHDVTTARYKIIDTWDSIDIDKFPIPQKGIIVNLENIDYKVIDVKYVYKHINKIIYIYITIYVKQLNS